MDTDIIEVKYRRENDGKTWENRTAWVIVTTARNKENAILKHVNKRFNLSVNSIVEIRWNYKGSTQGHYFYTGIETRLVKSK